MITLRDYVNWGIAHSDNVAKAEGVPLVMENCKLNKKMKELEVYGESVQSGTPSPEAPVEIESVGEPTVNLFDKDNIDNTRYLSVSLNEFATIELFKYRCTAYIEVKSNTTYIKSGDFGTSKAIGFFDADKNQIANIVSIDVDTPFTTPDNCCYIICNVGTDALPYDMCQIQEGSTATEYEPFGKYKVPVVMKGKNIFDKSNLKNFRYNGCSWAETSTGVVIKSYNNPAGQMSYVHLDLGYVSQYAGKTITATMKAIGVGSETFNNTMFVVCNSDSSDRVQKGTKSFVKEDNITYITLRYTVENIENKHLTLRLYINDVVGSTNYKFDEIMIHEGETPIPYEPYIEPVTTNVYLDEPLRRIGDYADVLDFKGKKVVRNTFVRVYDGQVDSDNPFNEEDNEANWGVGTGNENFWQYTLSDTLPIIPKGGYTDYKQIPICLQFPVKTGVYNASSSHATVENELIWFSQQGRNVRLFLSKSREELGDGSVSALIAYLKANPITVYCATYEPYEEPINCDLPTLTAKTSVIDIDTSVKPSKIKGKYIKR